MADERRPDTAQETTGRVARVPDKPALEGLEAKWGDRWQADGTYDFHLDEAQNVYPMMLPGKGLSEMVEGAGE